MQNTSPLPIDYKTHILIAVRGDAHEYAASLTALEQRRCPAREPAVAATGGNLMKRIRRLLYPAHSSNEWTPMLAAVVLMAMTAAILMAWQTAPAPDERSALRAGAGAVPRVPSLSPRSAGRPLSGPSPVDVSAGRSQGQPEVTFTCLVYVFTAPSLSRIFPTSLIVPVTVRAGQLRLGLDDQAFMPEPQLNR